MASRVLYEELKRIIAYIEAHLLEITCLDDCLADTYLSKYHVIHAFKRITGHTVMDYIRKRKMALALTDLTETDMRIIDISIKYGFEYEQSFSRVFRRYFEMTPTEYRRNPGMLEIQHPGKMRGFMSVGDNVILEPGYVHLPGIMLVGIQHQIQGNESVTKGKGRHAGYDFFYRHSRVIANPVNPEVYYGHTWHEAGNLGSSWYLPSLEVRGLDCIPEGMTHKTLPAAEYVVFTYIGKHPASEVTLRHLMVIHDFVDKQYHDREWLISNPFFFERIDTGRSADDYCEVELYFRIGQPSSNQEQLYSGSKQ